MKTPFKFLVGVVAGTLYGMAFSQKNGKKLRTELTKSKEPLKVLWEEAKKVFQDSKETVEQKSKKFELDPMLKKMNLNQDQIKSLKAILEKAKTKGGDAIKQLKEQFEAMSEEKSDEKETTNKDEPKTEKKSAPKKTATTKAAAEKKREFTNKVGEEK
jgi:gas vesicle protein